MIATRTIGASTLLIIGTLTTGCATEPSDWYPMTAMTGQMLAKCRAQSNFLPATGNAAANPFGAAAAQQQFINDCMAASGYSLR